MSPSPSHLPLLSLPFHTFSFHTCPSMALSAPLPWLLKLSNQESTPLTEVPLSMQLKQSMVDNVRRDLAEEAMVRGMTIIAMCKYLISLPFQTLTYWEKCLQDRWLGMQRTLPLLMTMGRSPSPPTVFDLSSSPPWRMSSPLTPLPSTARTTPLPIRKPNTTMSPHIPTCLACSSGIQSSTIKSHSQLLKESKHHMLPPWKARPSTIITSKMSRLHQTAASTTSQRTSGIIQGKTMSPSSLSTKTANSTRLTTSKLSCTTTPLYLLSAKVTLTFMGQPCMPPHITMKKEVISAM